jgi:ferredoxin-NADP reductase
LPKTSLKGTYVIVAGGTGIFPFLDLVALTLRYAVDGVSRGVFKNENNKIISDEEFNIHSSFKLILFVSYTDQQNIVYGDICEKLEKLSDKYNLDIFKYYERVSSIDKRRWGSGTFRDKLDNVKKDIKQVFLAGPVPFMDDMHSSLIESGIVTNDKIHFV